MIVSIIAAMDRNRLIGNKNQLPWHLPADLAHFKKVTMGKPIIMGRKTYDSIGRPLPGRTNIVLTRSPDFHADGVVTANTLEQALDGADKFLGLSAARVPKAGWLAKMADRPLIMALANPVPEIMPEEA